MHDRILRGCAELHPSFAACASAAYDSLHSALASFARVELEEYVAEGADGTPTMRIDLLVETAILEAASEQRVNVLSEEAGFVDFGSAVTLVVDPLDGSANAAAGVPIAGFSAALAIDDEFVEAAIVWLETGQTWAGTADGRVRSQPWMTTGRTNLDGAAVSLLRPHPHTRDAWWRVTERAARIRILSCSTIEAALVIQGSTDAFADAGSDTHRLVDIAAAAVLAPLAGGCVLDAFGRPVVFDTDLTKRWSGIVAATPELGDELAHAIRGGTHDDRFTPAIATAT